MVRTYVFKNSLKIIALGVLAAVTIWAGTSLVLAGSYLIALILVIGTGGITYIYLSKRTYPLRYLVPGSSSSSPWSSTRSDTTSTSPLPT